MNWNTFVQIVKDLLFNYKLSAEPHTAYTPIETIEFPNTYKVINPIIPDRQNNMFSGSEFGQLISQMSGQQRENAVIAECIKGNIPNWMRNFKEITITIQGNELVIFVAPDYLSIGNDNDFIRMPLMPISARYIADLYSCILPTKKLADIIWQQADLKLIPQPIPPSSNMSNTQSFIQHNNMIEIQRNNQNFTLITGIKKDIIIDKQLLIYKYNVGIYGWIYPNGQVIQGPMPNCISHSNTYLDYSHGVRLIAQTAHLNGKQINLYDVLNNTNYSQIISEQGFYDGRAIYQII